MGISQNDPRRFSELKSNIKLKNLLNGSSSDDIGHSLSDSYEKIDIQSQDSDD